MLVKVVSVANLGLESIGIDVEINISNRGLPVVDIVGLPNKSVDESKQRVRTAIINSGFEFPQQRIMINLAPADVPKEGSCYDLPIAAGLLGFAAGFDVPASSVFFGELSLDGCLRHTRGVLLAALFAKKNGIKNIFVPKASANEAAVVKGIKVYPVENLAQLTAHLQGAALIAPWVCRDSDISGEPEPEFDFAEVLGQERAKRAIEIAAAGGHNFMMVGSPGAGKTMLARALPGILPPLSESESLEVTKLYSAAGKLLPGSSLVKTRPFRAPHHTTSRIGLTGGGSDPQPGEISLAHRGVLFLDEFNEFSHSSIEALRQPLEDGYLTISRSRKQVSYPCRFILAASANPCPCGYLYDPKRACICGAREIDKYRKRVSGPIADRIDLHIEVKVVDVQDLACGEALIGTAEKSRAVREKILQARLIQARRFADEAIYTNAEMKNKQVNKYCRLDAAAKNVLTQGARKFQLSARSYFKLLKVSRTIADLDESRDIQVKHVAEALQYRPKIAGD